MSLRSVNDPCGLNPPPPHTHTHIHTPQHPNTPQTAASFAAALAQKVPTKIDIGPVYTVDPRQRAKYAKGAFLGR